MGIAHLEPWLRLGIALAEPNSPTSKVFIICPSIVGKILISLSEIVLQTVL
jgi:hypothetical protein